MSEPLRDSQAVAEHYAKLFAEYGDDPQSVGWQNAYVPIACFFQLIAVHGLEPGSSVLDVGCGLGHFKKFLDAHGVDVDYTGWDVCEPLLARARELHPESCFELRDILVDPGEQQFDFVMCSGSLTMMMADHHAWVADMVRAMFGRCRRALVFNALSAYYARDNPLWVDTERYYHAEPEAILALGLELSRQVVLDHCELANSFAVYVYKSNTRGIDRVARYLAPGRSYDRGHRTVAEYYRSFGMHDELAAYLRDLEPSVEVYMQLAIAAFHGGDREGRIAACRAAIDLEPDRLEPHWHLALAYMDAGHDDLALPALRRACVLAPDDLRIAYRLAVCCERTGDHDAARDAYRAVLAGDPVHKGALAALQRLS